MEYKWNEGCGFSQFSQLILTCKTENDILNISYKRKDGLDVGKFCKGDFQLNKVEGTWMMQVFSCFLLCPEEGITLQTASIPIFVLYF